MTKKVLERALEMAIADIANRSGSCPFDEFGGKHCEKNYLDCRIGIEKDCWKTYFIRKAQKGGR